MLTKTDRNGITTTYTYCAYGVTEENAGREKVYYTYDTLGRIASKSNPAEIIQYEYDYWGRVVREGNNSDSKYYTYDANSNVTNVSYPNDAVYSVSYTYDALGRLTSLTKDDILISYGYDNAGRLTSKTSGNLTTNYTYNNAGLVTMLENLNGDNVISRYTYGYTVDGTRITDNEENGVSKTYTYDGLNRLTNETHSNGINNSYTYDARGNRASMTTADGTYNYTYDLNNRLLTQTDPTGNNVTEYSYDANGNTLSELVYGIGINGQPQVEIGIAGNDNGNYKLYEYDNRNRVKKAYTGTQTIDYTYDTEGLRKSKSVNGVTTDYLWAQNNLIREKNPDNTSYYYYDNTGVAISELNGTNQYYLKNAHGDVTALANADGTIANTYLYDAFGNQLNTNTSDTNPFRYSGEYQDLCSGLIYLRNRYYDPSIGRFITEDPARDGLTWYVYANNNPVNAIDPSGLRTYFINGINNSKEEGSPQYSIDFANKLTEKGVEDVRTIGVYNGTGTITGVGQVAMEMVNKGKYAENVANKILEDLENDPLADGEELNLIGYSGGGQIVLNACELLQGKAKVDNSVLIGTPVSELTLNNTGETTMIYAGFDPLSWNVSWYPISLEFAGWIGHTSYFNKDNIGKVADLVNKHID